MVNPHLYRDCLDYIAERDNLNKSVFHPVMLSDVMAIEEELGNGLPIQYEEFITELGVGEEYGGLSKWLLLDLTVDENILNRNKELRKGEQYNKFKAPKHFFAVYDQHDGIFIGFQQLENKTLDEQVTAWDSETGELEVISDSFYNFLEANLDCKLSEFEEHCNSKNP
jgi:hypothetical protein